MLVCSIRVGYLLFISISQDLMFGLYGGFRYCIYLSIDCLDEVIERKHLFFVGDVAGYLCRMMRIVLMEEDENSDGEL